MSDPTVPRPPRAIKEGFCDMCRKPVGEHSKTECDYHAGYMDGYENRRRDVGNMLKELLK